MIWQKKLHIVALAVSVTFLTFILTRLNFVKIWHAFVGISWIWVVCVLLLNLLDTWIEATRWNLIVSSVKKAARTYIALAAISVGVLANTLLPLRVGDGVRAYFLSREEKISLASSLSTLMLDRLMDIGFFLILIALTAPFFHFPLSVERTELFAGGLLGIILVSLIVLMKFSSYLDSKLKGKPGRRISRQLNRFAMGLSALRDAGVLLPAGILSALSWGVRSTMVWTMFRAFHLNLPPVAAPVILIFVNLGIALVNTPANLGGFELATLAAFKLFEVDTEIALSYAIILHLVEVVPIVLLGLVVLWLSGDRTGELLGKMGGIGYRSFDP